MPRSGPSDHRSGAHPVRHPDAVPTTRPRSAANTASDDRHTAAIARDARCASGAAYVTCHGASHPATGGGDVTQARHNLDMVHQARP